ncbi:MAG: DUF2934 domain-containing protein [Gammaproteobacteria bacterium]
MAKASKKPVTASAVKAKKQARPRKKQNSISDDVKRQMIAEAAFYNSQKRAQLGGDPVQDWLLAEKQIEQTLNH